MLRWRASASEVSPSSEVVSSHAVVHRLHHRAYAWAHSSARWPACRPRELFQLMGLDGRNGAMDAVHLALQSCQC